MTTWFSSVPICIPADGTTGFAAAADGNTWPRIQLGIRDMGTGLTSVLERRSKEGPEMLELNL